jgi:hypothetical protein
MDHALAYERLIFPHDDANTLWPGHCSFPYPRRTDHAPGAGRASMWGLPRAVLKAARFNLTLLGGTLVI